MAVWNLWILCGVALLATEDASGLIIGGCEQGRVDVVEDSNVSFTYDAYQYNLILFNVLNVEMEAIFFGFCIKFKCIYWRDTFNSFKLDYYPTNNKYMLKMNGITRNSARILSCNKYLTCARCDFRIIAKPVYSPGDCSVNISNWMVIGSCTVRGMFSSDNNYTCKWRQNENMEEFGGFQTTLTNYTAKNSRIYTQGFCSFEKPIPTTEGNYTYSVSISPGSDDYFTQEIYIGEPYVVKLNHTCPEYVFEGSDVSCTCYASRNVTPPAVLAWEGKNNSTLLLTNVNRTLNEEQFACRLEWSPDGSIKESISYKLNVAYGPLNAAITTNENKTEDESETISLTCTATDVYPSAGFQWNVSCYNQTDSWNSSTCYLNFTQTIENLAIVCTATNKYYHQANASNVFILSSFLGNPHANTARANSGLIGGVVAAVVVVLIIIAVLIVYIVKRRKEILDRRRGFLVFFFGARKLFKQGPAMSKPNPVVNKPQTQTQAQNPITLQADPVCVIYTVTNTSSSGHVVDDYAAVCKTVNNNTGGTESPDTHRATQNTYGIREPTTALKPTTNNKPTNTKKTNILELPNKKDMNVYDVPTDSGLGVYHVAPWATRSQSTERDTSEYSVPTIPEDEYNELHFEEDRTGQEDQAENYHHLQIT